MKNKFHLGDVVAHVLHPRTHMVVTGITRMWWTWRHSYMYTTDHKVKGEWEHPVSIEEELVLRKSYHK